MGTLVNTIAVVVGSLLGLLLKNKISRRFVDQVTLVLGCSVVIVGIVGLVPAMINVEDGKLQAHNTMLLIISLVFGYGLGHALAIEKSLNRFGDYLERKVHKEAFAKGFISASLLFCVGAMTFSGAILDGLGQPQTLYLKSIMDFVSSIILAATLGYGVLFSAVTIFVYQGTLFLLASILNGVMPIEMIGTIEMIGYAIVIILGFNLMKVTKIETANLLPAILIPIAYYYLCLLF